MSLIPTPPAAMRVTLEAVPFVPRSRAARESWAYLRRAGGADLRVTADRLAAALLPRARHGQRVAAAELLYRLLRTTSRGVQIGREELAAAAGVCRRTVTSTLNALRAALVWRPWPGRKGQGVAIYTATDLLLTMAADTARGLAAARRAAGYRAAKSQPKVHGAKRGTNVLPSKVPVPLTPLASVIAGGPDCPHGVPIGRRTSAGTSACPRCRRC